MASLEGKAIADMRTPPKLWLRFVDDVLAIIKKNLAKEILDHLNRQDPNIVFTMDLEENGRLPYLDSMIHCSNHKLTTTVYRKPTHTDRYLPYDSHHPRSAKCSVVDSLLKRAEDVITSEPEKGAESHRIELALKTWERLSTIFHHGKAYPLPNKKNPRNQQNNPLAKRSVSPLFMAQLKPFSACCALLTSELCGNLTHGSGAYSTD